MGEADLRARFPRRYDLYTKALKAELTDKSLPNEELAKMQQWFKTLNGLDDYIEKHNASVGDRTLYDRQFTVFEDLRNFLEQDKAPKGYVKLPTGTGKTVLFTEFIEAVNLRTLVVVPRKLLVDQTTDAFAEFASDLDVGKLYTDASQLGRQVTVTTYDSLVRKIKSGELKPEDYDCLILDEAHKALTKERISVIQKFNHALQLGFTATPTYSEEKQVSNLLPTEIHTMSAQEAVDAELITPLSVLVAEVDIDLSNVKVTDGGEYDAQTLGRAINITSHNKAAVELYKKIFKGQKAVAYCAGVDHAQALAEYFNKQGIRAGVIYGKQTIGEQKEAKETFAKDSKDGGFDVICNADILIEGFDEPKASVCLNLRPTSSPVIAEQRAGRVMRLNQ
ncbi:MAG: DEAD/DEAH box helicase, partial [Patescibacteria group bacterium]